MNLHGSHGGGGEGKLDLSLYSPARRSGFPANWIDITLFTLDKEPINIFMLFLYIFLTHFISDSTLNDFSRLL